jgi:hypothetical protein
VRRRHGVEELLIRQRGDTKEKAEAGTSHGLAKRVFGLS